MPRKSNSSTGSQSNATNLRQHLQNRLSAPPPASSHPPPSAHHQPTTPSTLPMYAGHYTSYPVSGDSSYAAPNEPSSPPSSPTPSLFGAARRRSSRGTSANVPERTLATSKASCLRRSTHRSTKGVNVGHLQLTNTTLHFHAHYLSVAPNDAAVALPLLLISLVRTSSYRRVLPYALHVRCKGYPDYLFAFACARDQLTFRHHLELAIHDANELHSEGSNDKDSNDRDSLVIGNLDHLSPRTSNANFGTAASNANRLFRLLKRQSVANRPNSLESTQSNQSDDRERDRDIQAQVQQNAIFNSVPNGYPGSTSTHLPTHLPPPSFDTDTEAEAEAGAEAETDVELDAETQAIQAKTALPRSISHPGDSTSSLALATDDVLRSNGGIEQRGVYPNHDHDDDRAMGSNINTAPKNGRCRNKRTSVMGKNHGYRKSTNGSYDVSSSMSKGNGTSIAVQQQPHVHNGSNGSSGSGNGGVGGSGNGNRRGSRTGVSSKQAIQSHKNQRGDRTVHTAEQRGHEGDCYYDDEDTEMEIRAETMKNTKLNKHPSSSSPSTHQQQQQQQPKQQQVASKEGAGKRSRSPDISSSSSPPSLSSSSVSSNNSTGSEFSLGNVAKSLFSSAITTIINFSPYNSNNNKMKSVTIVTPKSIYRNSNQNQQHEHAQKNILKLDFNWAAFKSHATNTDAFIFVVSALFFLCVVMVIIMYVNQLRGRLIVIDSKLSRYL